MSKQYNKVIKRKRRKAYLERCRQKEQKITATTKTKVKKEKR